MVGSLCTSITQLSEFSPSLEKSGMKKRQDTTVPGAATNTDVADCIAEATQDLAKDSFDCYWMAMQGCHSSYLTSGAKKKIPAVLVLAIKKHSQAVFTPKPVFANTCH